MVKFNTYDNSEPYYFDANSVMLVFSCSRSALGLLWEGLKLNLG